MKKLQGLVDQIIGVVQDQIGVVIQPDKLEMLDEMIADQIKDWTEDDNIDWAVLPKWVAKTEE